MKLMKINEQVILVTSDYHQQRALMVFQRVFGETYNFSAFGASSSSTLPSEIRLKHEESEKYYISILDDLFNKYFFFHFHFLHYYLFFVSFLCLIVLCYHCFPPPLCYPFLCLFFKMLVFLPFSFAQSSRGLVTKDKKSETKKESKLTFYLFLLKGSTKHKQKIKGANKEKMHDINNHNYNKITKSKKKGKYMKTVEARKKLAVILCIICVSLLFVNKCVVTTLKHSKSHLFLYYIIITFKLSIHFLLLKRKRASMEAEAAKNAPPQEEKTIIPKSITNNRKFDENKQYRFFPGNTAVCMVTRNSKHAQVREEER